MKKFTFEEVAENYEFFYSVEEAFEALGNQPPRFYWRDPFTGNVEQDTVHGWLQRLGEFLQEVQRRCIFKAVCLHCRPGGVYHNLMRYAKNFAEEAVKEINPSDLYYEISPLYTKDHCPSIVEFEL